MAAGKLQNASQRQNFVSRRRKPWPSPPMLLIRAGSNCFPAMIIIQRSFGVMLVIPSAYPRYFAVELFTPDSAAAMGFY